ncbi:MAG: hypothetical protein K6A36_04465 [Paludibacteraceae bacterium]|nr:hypothetical protein [Paludibacteraceae bacterium]
MKKIRFIILLMMFGLISCEDTVNTANQPVFVVKNNTNEYVVMLLTLREEVVKSGYPEGGLVEIQAHNSVTLSFPKYPASKTCKPSNIFTGLTFLDQRGIVIKDVDKIYNRAWEREHLYWEGSQGDKPIWVYTFEGK